MIVKEIHAKTILSKSKVFDYTVNPYIGCEHACAYCYARFMKRYTGHKEAWGQFVDVKINAADLLRHDLQRKKKGLVWVSGTCDPYQPLEKKYELTKRCLDVLSRHRWPVRVQTKSPLVTRDLELLRKFEDVEVGFTIATSNENVREVFEPNAPSIAQRVRALDQLHSVGVKTFAMIAPLLPGAEGLAVALVGKVDYVLIDRMNYHYADSVYRQHDLEQAMTKAFFDQTKTELADAFEKENIRCQLLF